MTGELHEQEIVARLRFATMRLYRRMREESAKQTTLTQNGYSALSTIEARGPVRMTDLARIEKVSKSSITRVVGNLSEMGLIELLPDENDGRSTLVGATQQGKQVLAAVSEQTEAFLKHQITNFSDAEKAMLEAAVLLLERLAGRSRGQATGKRTLHQHSTQPTTEVAS